MEQLWAIEKVSHIYTQKKCHKVEIDVKRSLTQQMIREASMMLINFDVNYTGHHCQFLRGPSSPQWLSNPPSGGEFFLQDSLRKKVQ